MPRVSQRKCIGRRKKGYRSVQPKNKSDQAESQVFFDHSYASVAVSTKCDDDQVQEVDSCGDESGWEHAWINFQLDAENLSDFEMTSESSELQDSDKCSADQFFVVLHKVFQYSAEDDLDQVVNRLRTERLYSHFLTLQAELQGNIAALGSFSLGKADTHGIRLMQHYGHNFALSLKLCLTISPSLKAALHIHGKELSLDHDFWIGLPNIYCSLKDVQKLVSKLESWDVCVGNSELEYVSMVPPGIGIYGSAHGTAVAYRENVSAERGDLQYDSTVRSTKCHLLVSTRTRCKHCDLYRSTLRKQVSRRKNQHQGTFSLKKTPHKHMSKKSLIQKIDVMRDEKKSIQAELGRYKRQVSNVIKTKGHLLSHGENEELLKLLENYTGDVQTSFPDENSVQRLFWEQQLKYARLRQKSAMKWHPMIIKWCLYLRSKSQKAYDVARDSGFIALPSSRTLFDYSHALPSQCGFRKEYTDHLIQEATSLGMYEEEWKSYVGILQDEVKVSEGLVYDKTSGELVGYVELDKTGNEINNMENLLHDSEAKLATSILVVMVRGITTSLKYPFFCLATNGVKSTTLFPPIWEAVRILEGDCGLRPLFITCDGATPNRRFFKLHYDENLNNTFWTWNPFSFPERKLFFISDVPHLLKTTRNCFSNSGAHNLARHLWKDGKNISWTHIIQLYEEYVEPALFAHAHKLTRTHVHLTSFAKMKVNLAAQVLSKTVADALDELYGDHISETVKFISHMNRFFDCLNTRNLAEANRKRNPDLSEYRRIDDPRLSYLTDEFLQYFQEWEDSVMNRPGVYTRSQRRKMLLSQQTLNGLHLTVNSIVECVKLLLREGAEFVLTHRFNQDPLEEHFSHYRQKGGSNDNPSVYDVKNTLCQLRVIGSGALAPIRGNISNKRKRQQLTVDNTKLAKRPR